jgi:hypothetical protein
MEIAKEPDAYAKSFSKQMKDLFSDEEMASFVLTLLGMSDIAHRFIWEKVKDFMELPVDVKYSLVQHASVYRTLSLVARDEYDKENKTVGFMPIGGASWKSDDDFEKRFIFVVKTFYEHLKEEGKI